MKNAVLVLICTAFPLVGQQIQLTVNGNGYANAIDPPTYPDRPGVYGPFLVATVSSSPPGATVTIEFAGSFAGSDFIKFENGSDSSCTDTLPSIAVQTISVPIQLRACLFTPPTGGSFFEFVYASSPGFASVSDGWRVSSYPGGNVSVSPNNVPQPNGQIKVGVTVGNSGSYEGLNPYYAPSNSPPWLQIDESACLGPPATTGSTCTVTISEVNLPQLTPGQRYSVQVTFFDDEAPNNIDTVLLDYTPPSPKTLTSSPSSLTFIHEDGSANSAAQNINVGSSGSALNVTASSSTTSGGSWLEISPSSVNTPAPFTVSVNASGLAAGQYAGSITLSASGASNSPLVIPVQLTVSPQRMQSQDFFGGGRDDFAVWRPREGNWYILPSGDASGPTVRQWGLYGDVPVPGDYDGDRTPDVAVWRPSEGDWYITPSTAPSIPMVKQWGLPGDIPVPGDYDGDGKVDYAVWRPSEGNWYIIPSTAPLIPIVRQWGLPGDIPVPGDYDGDGKVDYAVWRPSEGNWYIIPSTAPSIPMVKQWGLPGDIPVPGDYDGDGKLDYAVWRPSEGNWYIIPSNPPSIPIVQQWGLTGDVP